MRVTKATPQQLMALHARILSELAKRKIVRTRNNPIGDYTEWLVADKLGFALAANSKAGYDATDGNGIRYQIKARRIVDNTASERQLSAIRNLAGKDFDVLIAVLFDHEYNIHTAVSIPHEVIGDYAKYKPHTNAHELTVNAAVINDERVTKLDLERCSNEI